MLTFLRKIRKSLIESGSVRKYTFYAIGEIALVVIGILIALQINNWNEAQRDAEFETAMLSEIHSSLKKDLDLISILESRCFHLSRAASQIIDAIEGRISISDEAFNAKADSCFWQVRFSYDIGPYEALKSSGIEKITNSKLRQDIIRYYEISVPRSIGQNEDVNKKYSDISQRNIESMLSKDLLKMNVTGIGDGIYEDDFFFDQELLKNQKVFYESIIWQLRRFATDRYRLESSFEKTSDLIGLIDKELNK